MILQRSHFSTFLCYAFFSGLALLLGSCTFYQNYSYYDGIYEDPKHVPNTVFSEEMNKYNGLSSIELDTSTTVSPNNTNTRNESSTPSYTQEVNIYNHRPYYDDYYWDSWNWTTWNDPFWAGGFHWNRNRWGWNMGWNQYSAWGYNNPFWNYYGYAPFYTLPYFYNRPVNNPRNSKYYNKRSNSNTYRQSRYYTPKPNSRSSYSSGTNNSNTQRQSSYRRSSSNNNSSYNSSSRSSRSYNSGSSSNSSSSSSRSSSSSKRSNSNSYRRR
ncbi:hypothetical protein [Ochrovirga pacifica]|uniref:hypothetical protein n=1 Tax=Ochrovirga pacifica TaxID=1042376 RepID=UPI0002559FF7|nr:hypothetical protein [Ochrovirga pacifica]